MFYRANFDSWVGGILRASGIRTNDQKLAWWPTGSTKVYIRQMKSMGKKPLDGACLAVALEALRKVKEGVATKAHSDNVASYCEDLAREQGLKTTLDSVVKIREEISALTSPPTL